MAEHDCPLPAELAAVYAANPTVQFSCPRCQRRGTGAELAPGRCPRCGGMLIADREDGAACFACGHRPAPPRRVVAALEAERAWSGNRRPKHGKTRL